MHKLRTLGHWLADEWPVPRWICLLLVIGWIVDIPIRVATR